MNTTEHNRTDGPRSHSRFRTRLGAVSFVTVLVVAILVLVLLSILLYSLSRQTPGVADLNVFCAAGMRYPMERIVEDYQDKYGVTVRVQYGGSNSLLSQLELGGVGDLYLAADDSYIQIAKEKGLGAEVLPLATMRPVIAVPKENKHEIKSIDDLLKPGLRIGCGNPDAAAIGKRAKQLLEKSGDWEAIDQRIRDKGVYKPTVNDVANDVIIGAIDAGIVWDSTAAQYPELTAISVPAFDAGVSSVEICVLNSCKDPKAALHFARYVGACDKGLAVFEEEHFNVVEGDEWAEVPELTLFAGSVNRRALDPILEAFKKREGVELNTIYNGCGILTGQMRVIEEQQKGTFPDTYMACDVYYLNTVKDLFQEAVNVSDTDIVIAVAKGNPKDIHSLEDLLKPGIRVVIGEPTQCTIGVLTKRLLEHEGIYQQLMDNHVVAQKESSAALVPSVTTKSCDATLAYRTDTLAESDKVDVITLDSELCKAIQPFSIARSSKQKYLSRRLFQAIANSRESFESVGFHWRLDESDQSEP